MDENLYTVLQCRYCMASLFISSQRTQLCCSSGHTYSFDRDHLIYGDFNEKPVELGIRNRQAFGYLAHSKFPNQITRVDHFLRSVGKQTGGRGELRLTSVVDLALTLLSWLRMGGMSWLLIFQELPLILMLLILINLHPCYLLKQI